MWLALVPCGMGAYNLMSVPVLVTRGNVARRMKVAEFDFAPGFTEPGGPPVLVNAEWDASTGRLSSYAKGRGLGLALLVMLAVALPGFFSLPPVDRDEVLFSQYSFSLYDIVARRCGAQPVEAVVDE